MRENGFKFTRPVEDKLPEGRHTGPLGTRGHWDTGDTGTLQELLQGRGAAGECGLNRRGAEGRQVGHSSGCHGQVSTTN